MLPWPSLLEASTALLAAGRRDSRKRESQAEVRGGVRKGEPPNGTEVPVSEALSHSGSFPALFPSFTSWFSGIYHWS